MRVDVHKYLFIGAAVDKHTFFKAAQAAGIIEFINPEGKKRAEIPADIEKIAHAIKILRSYVHLEQEHKKELEGALEIADQILKLRDSATKSEQLIHELSVEIERIAPFGQFEPEKVKELEGQIGSRFRFFCAKTAKHLADIEPALILVNQKDGMDYFIAIQNEPVASVDLEELHFSQSLEHLLSQRKEHEERILKADEEIKQLTRYDHYLHQALIHRINESSLANALSTSEFELENQLFMAEGWVPDEYTKKLDELVHVHNVYSERVATDRHEMVPTFLSNQGTSKVGEDLIRIFDTPSVLDKDPSLWVLFAFALFFSMIVYDAGYGLIFLATALLLRFRVKNLTQSAKRFIGLMAILSVFCTLWGGLTHSFFGIKLSPDNQFRKHSLMTYLITKKATYHLERKDDVYQFYLKSYPELKDAKTPQEFLYLKGHHPSHSETPVADKFTDNVLMELALFLGAIHICLGLARYLGYNLAGAGWIAFILGSYLYLPHYLQAASLINYVFGIDRERGAEFGLHLLFAGVIFATVVGIFKHGFAGVFEPMHSIQIFADILSYLRLYALGYAGFIVSETVNDLSLKLPLFFTILVMVAGHLLNIILAVMGGTIHGLRLNFLEWYRYSFYGGGKDFQPLRLHTLE